MRDQRKLFLSKKYSLLVPGTTSCAGFLEKSLTLSTHASTQLGRQCLSSLVSLLVGYLVLGTSCKARGMYLGLRGAIFPQTNREQVVLRRRLECLAVECVCNTTYDVSRKVLA